MRAVIESLGRHFQAVVHGPGDAFPLDRAEAAAILGRDLPGAVDVTIDEKGKGVFNLAVRTLDKKGDVIVSDKRELDFNDGHVGTGWFVTDEAWQGRGVGRTLMRNEIELAYRCGLRRMDILAGLTNGGYSWARFGFLPVFANHPATLKFKVGLLKDEVSPATGAVLKSVAALDEKKHLWTLADIDEDIVPALDRIFNGKAAPQTYAFLDEEKKAKTNAGHLHRLDEMRKAAVVEGKPLPFGRTLLSSHAWDGYMDFSDQEQLRRAAAYAGGFQHIAWSGHGMKEGRGIDRAAAIHPV